MIFLWHSKDVSWSTHQTLIILHMIRPADETFYSLSQWVFHFSHGISFFFFFSTLLYLIHFHILNLLPCFIRLLFLFLILFFSLWVLFCLLWTVWTTSSKLFLYNLWLEILSCSQEGHDFGNGNSLKKKIRLTYLFPLMLDTSLWIFLIKLSFSSF